MASKTDDTLPPKTPAPLVFKREELGQVVEQWYRERINNSRIASNTDVVNHVRAAVDDLKTRLGI